MKPLLICIAIVASLVSRVSHAEFKLPAYERYMLANGLTVYLMQQQEVPLIDVQLVVRAGAVKDQQHFGLANITGDALMFGAGDLTKTQIEDQFAFLGANFQSTSNKEQNILSLSFAAKDQDLLLPIFANLAQKPLFDVDEFTKYKTRYLASLAQQRESPRNIVGDAFNRLYFGLTPYGNPVGGDSHSVANINLTDVKQFYQQQFVPTNSALIVVGDFDQQVWRKKIELLFGGWQATPQAEPALAVAMTAQVQPKANRVLLIDKSDAMETTFMIGGRGISANHPDTVAISVLNTILGGRFTSWLNDALRVSSGLTYGARSRFSSFAQDGNFYISTFTKTESTFEAIDLALKTYQKIWTQGIDEATLASAKAYVKGQFPPNYETSGQLASLLSRMWTLGLQDSYINDFEQKVDNLTVEQANKLAQQYFPKDNLQYVLIGKAEALRDRAKQYGELVEQEIKTYKF